MKKIQSDQLLLSCPKIDVHTHLTPTRMMARGLDDILLYHMVNTELYAAGCPEGGRVGENRSEEEAIRRLEIAVPYVRQIENTSMYWILKTILADLYDWNDGITEGNWRGLHERIMKHNIDDEKRARGIFETLNIRRIGTELSRRRNDRFDDLFSYALEWAFFARVQWNQPDVALYELERTWDADSPGESLPVTVTKEGRPVVSSRIRTANDVRKAIRHYCDVIPYDSILATAQHLSTAIHYDKPDAAVLQQAIDNREHAGAAERDVYSSALLHEFLGELSRRSPGIVFQFSLGAEALPFESGAFLRQDTLVRLAEIIANYPDVSFMCFNASRHGHHSLCTMARELPNLSLAGFWWHGFFTGAMLQMAEERLDMVPMNKQCDFLTDAYCADWVYGKTRFILGLYERLFSEKLSGGQYTIGQVERIARAVFHDSAVEILGFPGV